MRGSDDNGSSGDGSSDYSSGGDGSGDQRAGGATDTGQDATELAGLLELEPAAPERTLRYGDHPSQVIDCFGTGPPRIAALHGGFWRERFDRAHLSPFAAALAGHGMSVALVEYRRSGGGGGHPETFDDVTAALEAVWTAADGRSPLLLGHSAGGQLALWAASRLPERVRHTVGVAPVADLRLAAELGLGGGAVSEFLGADWAELLEVADPVRLPSPSGPVTLVHGTADQQVPLDLSLNYAEQRPAQLLRLPGVGHYAPVVPHGLPFTTLALALRNLLDEPVR